MRPYTLLALALAAAAVSPGVSSNAQRQHRRAARPRVHHTAGPAKDGRQSNVTSPEESAKAFAACLASDDAPPRIDTKWEFNSALCGKAISKPVPSYPVEAKAAKVSGLVTVQGAVNEQGRVFWVRVVNGHPLLQEAAKKAACQARFSPTLVSGRALRTGIVITYNFVLQ